MTAPTEQAGKTLTGGNSANLINRLTAPFAPGEHEVREGAKSRAGDKVAWFVYVRKDAIRRRLDEVFPLEWEGKILGEPRYANDAITVTYEIVIRGIARQDIGGYSGQLSGENAEMAAATFAFKRAAMRWGIGDYLQNMPQIWTDRDYIIDGKRTDYRKRTAREREAVQRAMKWIAGEFGGEIPSQPAPADYTDRTPESGGGPTDAPAPVAQWPTEELVERLIAHSTSMISRDFGVSPERAEIVRYAGLAGRGDNIQAWGEMYDTGRAAGEAILAAFRADFERPAKPKNSTGPRKTLNSDDVEYIAQALYNTWERLLSDFLKAGDISDIHTTYEDREQALIALHDVAYSQKWPLISDRLKYMGQYTLWAAPRPVRWYGGRAAMKKALGDDFADFESWEKDHTYDVEPVRLTWEWVGGQDGGGYYKVTDAKPAFDLDDLDLPDTAGGQLAF